MPLVTEIKLDREIITNANIVQYKKFFKSYICFPNNINYRRLTKRVLDKEEKRHYYDQKVITEDQCVNMI